MQFGALMLTSVLTIDLASRSLRLAGRVYNLSRWLMVTGIGLIAVQFLLQYTLHFRHASVTQGVAVNLVFFMLSSWLVSLAVLNLQQLRKDGIMPWMVEYLNEVRQPFADQDAFNKPGIEQDKFVPLDVRYNESFATGMTNDPAIVHYCGYTHWWADPRMPRGEYLRKYQT